MKKTTRTLLLIILSFAIYFIFDDFYFKDIRLGINEQINQIGVSHILTYLITGIPLFAGTLLIGKSSDFLKNLGLDKSVFKALAVAICSTAPMFIGFSLLFDFQLSLNSNKLLITVVAAGFFEELYFRAFLFGLPYRKARLGFLPSVFFGAFYFGALHLYQSTEFYELLGIFGVTFLGGILFAWVYTEWNFNIWVSVFLHMFTNLAWELFEVSDNALGGVYANIFRLLTLILIIVITVLYKKRSGKKLEVSKSTLWFLPIFKVDSTKI